MATYWHHLGRFGDVALPSDGVWVSNDIKIAGSVGASIVTDQSGKHHGHLVVNGQLFARKPCE